MAKLKALGVTSGSGGAGKTLLATNLALGVLQQVRGGVLFLDASYPCPGDACARMGMPRAKSIADLIPLLDRLTPEFLTTYLMSAPSGVPCLTLVSDVVQAPSLTRQVLDQVFKVLDAAFDYLIIDLGVTSGDVAGFLLDRIDQMCVVVEPTAHGVARAQHLMGLLRAAQFPASATVVCLNRVHERSAVGSVSQLGLTVIGQIPLAVEAVSWAEHKQRLLLELRPEHEVSALFADLSRAFVQRAFRQRAEAARDVPEATEDARLQLKLKILRRLIEEIDLRKGDLGYLHDPVKRQEMHVRVEGKLTALVQEEASAAFSRQDRRELVQELIDEALGLGALDDGALQAGLDGDGLRALGDDRRDLVDHLLGDGRHPLDGRQHLLGDRDGGHAEPGDLGDVHGQVAHALEVGHHAQGGDEHPEVAGHRLLQREELEAELLDPLALGVDVGVVGDDLLGELRVGLEQGRGGPADGGADLPGHGDELVDDQIELLVVGVAHAPTVTGDRTRHAPRHERGVNR